VTNFTVIPAKAGTQARTDRAPHSGDQLHRHPGESRDPGPYRPGTPDAENNISSFQRKLEPILILRLGIFANTKIKSFRS